MHKLQRKWNMKSLFVVFILILTATSSNSQQQYTIKEYGRRIQLDGFLLEWKQKSAHSWTDDQQWFWDAVNTPEGITGYFKSKSKQPCSIWTFTFNSQGCITPFIAHIDKGTLVEKQSFFAFDKQLLLTSGEIVVEWVIPWNKACLNGSGDYSLTFKGYDSCGNSLPAVTIVGNQKIRNSKSVWNGTAIRIFVIAVLTIVFIIMRRRIRRRRSQTQ